MSAPSTELLSFIDCQADPSLPSGRRSARATVITTSAVLAGLALAIRFHEASHLAHPEAPWRHYLALLLGGTLGTLAGLTIAAVATHLLTCLQRALFGRH